jgi:acetolactate synthase I/II/III large subunit
MVISGGELLLNIFEACGVEYIFCSPGTEWTPVWEALLKRRDKGDNSLKYINCRHEILAVTAAEGYAEVTGRLPAVLLHSSVGPLMGAMAMRNASSARAPVLIFSGETYRHYDDAEVKAQGWQWLGMLADMGGPSALVKGYVKWSNAVKSRESLVDCVVRGAQIALTAPYGPVFISVPPEVLLQTGAEKKIKRAFPVPVTLEPAESDLDKVARLLVKSNNPVIIADRAGQSPGSVKALAELAETLSIPVFDTILHFKSNINRDNPLYQGQITPEILKEADTVFVIDSVVPWYPESAGPGDNAWIIMLDEDINHEKMPYWGYRADITINANAEAALTTLVKTVKAEKSRPKTPPERYQKRLERWKKNHDAMISDMNTQALAVRENKPIASRWLFQAAQNALPFNSIILDETIVYTHLLYQYLAEPGRFFKTNYGGLGLGMGAALGVKLAEPERPVVLFVGDGAFNYNPVLPALGLSQEYNLPVFIIILNNCGYMAMRKGYHTHYPQGWAVCHDDYLGVNINPAPDYVKVAEAFGAYGEKLDEPGKIEAALKRGLKQVDAGKTALLDVCVGLSL